MDSEFSKIFAPIPPFKKTLKHLKRGDLRWYFKIRKLRKLFPKVALAFNVEVVGDIEIGQFTYIGSSSTLHTYSREQLGEVGLRIGKYCSIASHFFASTIPVTHTTTTPSLYPVSALFDFRSDHTTFDLNKENRIRIGNDVWIGADVKIIGNVTIGDGAIIGRDALVTKDVPPYHVALGIPATIKKQRFSDSIIEQLLEIKWWNWTEDKIKKNTGFFNLDLVQRPDITLTDFIID